MNPDQVSSAIGFIRGSASSESLLAEPAQKPLQTELVDTELRFYRSYPWCLNIFPTIGEVVQHLRHELSRLDRIDEDWQYAEVMTNVFLLCSSISDTIDDYVLGDHYDFSQAMAVLPVIRPVIGALERLLEVSRKCHWLRVRRLRKWREDWEIALEEFLKLFVSTGSPNRDALSHSIRRLTSLLLTEFPGYLLSRRPRIPAAFRSQDLTHFDILSLGQKFVRAYPDRERPLVVVGLRTAGSYFTPLLRAYLRTEGYQDVECVTVRPKKGLAIWEKARLARCARRGALAVILDEPPNTSSTLAKAVGLLRKAGVMARDTVALLPVHPVRRDWNSGYEFLPLTEVCILTLEPDEWYKHRLLEPDVVDSRLQAYFQRRNYVSARVMASTTAERFNAQLQRLSEEKFHTRLKRVYEVRLQDQAHRIETRYVLAKSVGWGWMGYHAFIASDELSDFVPPVLGLRDGIQYTEWLPQSDPLPAQQDREQLLHTAASYVAARVRSLNLGRDPVPELSRNGQHKGFDLLADVLSRAYGWKIAAVLKRGRIRHKLSRHPAPLPTLIDGKMRSEEWIIGSGSFLKTDFEHHGLGKTKLNVTDPAYDLAEAILYFRLSRGDEKRLIERYVEESGDTSVEERLFFNKLLVGTWAMAGALDNLGDPRLASRHQEFNEQYVEARKFLTVQTARFCASVCRRVETVRWRSPLVVMDIDGVLDKQIFGFPSSTAAGIKALSLLHAHDCAIAVNTARTVSEVKEYSNAYGFVGGVAEYGSAIWDAMSDRERVLVSGESLIQLERLRDALRQIPGVFLDESYQYSIRTYTYERGTTVPVPTTMIRNLMARLETDRLRFHQTYVDTAVLAKEIDKGKGLLALLELAGQRELETVAIGDSEPDLAMFRVASRCFAPSHISCRSVARMLGCQITDRSYQRGLLSAVGSIIIHPHGNRCDRCRSCDLSWPRSMRLFEQLLEASDEKPWVLLLRALLDPLAFQAFAK
jgi:hydroxymethylpyrimidine pyrophosphatase-like HAD family hydrolase